MRFVRTLELLSVTISYIMLREFDLRPLSPLWCITINQQLILYLFTNCYLFPVSHVSITSFLQCILSDTLERILLFHFLFFSHFDVYVIRYISFIATYILRQFQHHIRIFTCLTAQRVKYRRTDVTIITIGCWPGPTKVDLRP